VITKQLPNDTGSTIEIAHEVIFRVWSRFRHWLEPEKARLEALRDLESAARVWEQHKRSAAYLDHRGRRLKAARALLDHEDFKDEIDPNEQAYLKAASRAQRVRRVVGSVALVAVVSILGGSSWQFVTDTSPMVGVRLFALNVGLTQFAGPEMVEVPIDPEGFLMGSPEDDEDRFDDEGPQHEVTIAEPFAMGVYEVTFDDWDVCYFDGGCNEYHPSDESWGRGGRPVINVSWDDAQAYVEWLSDLTDEAYRLPSEAEWEYAARAGTTTVYALPAPDGSDDISGKGLANCDGCGSEWDDRQTAPVGSFEANAFGLHDMHGNVWEWRADVWHDSYAGAPTDGSAWFEGGDQDRRVLRGGSWFSGPRGLRSAYRSGFEPGLRDVDGGFRVARTLR
jgi:formylglycine-generating enzyme required for sulfatase activity